MSIADKVAILGMGCSRFGERWDCGVEDLIAEAVFEALSDADVETTEIQAAWLGAALPEFGMGGSGVGLSMMMGLDHTPVTRVENFCASGTEAFRGAVYAVASGAVDIAIAVGGEKLKESGFGGLPPNGQGLLSSHAAASASGPGVFAQLASAYRAAHGVSPGDLKRAMAHVSVKSHDNAAGNVKAHLRNRISEEQVLNAPIIAEPLGLYDCCGVSDGAACAIVTRPDIARARGKHDLVTVKAVQLAATNGYELESDAWNGAYVTTTRAAAARAYKEAGIEDPASGISLTEVHDCFSITELVTMEDLGLSKDGRAWADILDGRYDADGAIPCQIDGGLKCFGHPVGASGLRMIYEMYLQLQGRAGSRQRSNVNLGLTHNLGGGPSRNIAAICIIGREGRPA